MYERQETGSGSANREARFCHKLRHHAHAITAMTIDGIFKHPFSNKGVKITARFDVSISFFTFILHYVSDISKPGILGFFLFVQHTWVYKACLDM